MHILSSCQFNPEQTKASTGISFFLGSLCRILWCVSLKLLKRKRDWSVNEFIPLRHLDHEHDEVVFLSLHKSFTVMSITAHSKIWSAQSVISWVTMCVDKIVGMKMKQYMFLPCAIENIIIKQVYSSFVLSLCNNILCTWCIKLILSLGKFYYVVICKSTNLLWLLTVEHYSEKLGL